VLAGVIHSSRLVAWAEAKMQRDGKARQQEIRAGQGVLGKKQEGSASKDAAKKKTK
jgi:hypothetical protein